MRQFSGIFGALLFLIVLAGPAMALEIPFDDSELPFALSTPDSGQGAPVETPAAAENDNASPEPQANAPALKPLTGKEKFRYFLGSTFGPMSFMSSVAGTAIRQGIDSVPEWEQGMEGYGKRFASSFGQKIVEQTLQQGTGALLREDPRYFNSGRQGIFRRTIYGIGTTFVSHKDSGGIRPAYARFIGAFGAVWISRQWYPQSHATAGDYITSGAISISLDVAGNVFNEFWPDLKKLILH